eukprot:TRINITY_DN58197_c0_g1_i1.p1 TRINITY_DN58197_c0_g1~~TRINITY_DN58197_c0_g1_i1.p1  ORF type:complete len:246 (-),score=18.47 TRINITY_DN58197_c0_g1_i1:232-969(-)
MPQSHLPWACSRKRKSADSESSVAQLLIHSKLPLELAHTVEFCDYGSLLRIAASSSASLRSIKSLAAKQASMLDFTLHRGCFDVPRKHGNRDSLHYSDSLLSSLEPIHAFHDACIAQANSARYGYIRHEEEHRERIQYSIDWHVQQRSEHSYVKWQAQLFAAMHPAIARATPHSWRPSKLRELWVLAQGRSSSACEIASELSAKDARFPACVLRRVMRSSMYWHSQECAWHLSEPFQLWLRNLEA